jgi:aspartate 1-decarboxylase
MLIEFCKAKIAHGRVTDAHLQYEGSISLAEDLIKAADLIPGQKVHVLNMNNGERFETYVIIGPKGSGEICLNGPAARLGLVGDQVVILSYVLVEPEEARKTKTKIIYLDENNRLKTKD